MATADQLARDSAAQFDFQIKIYVSGPRQWLDLADIAAGASLTVPGSTTLSADVEPSDDVIRVVDGSVLTRGVLVIEPSTSDETYEMVGYDSIGTSTDALATEDDDQLVTEDDEALIVEGTDGPAALTLTRGWSSNVEPFFAGRHAAGATVSEWIDVTALALGGDLAVEESDVIVTWSLSLHGNHYNSNLLARNNAVLVMWRFRPASGVLANWTDWGVAAKGYIKEASLSDTHTRERRWTMKIEGVAQYLGGTDAEARQFGVVNLALNKSVTESSVLSDPFLERDSGEFIGSPDLSGASAVDGDRSTLWISNDEPSIAEESHLATFWALNELYLQAPVGDPVLWWLEVAFKRPDGKPDDGDLKYYALVTKATTWDSPDTNNEQTVPKSNYWNFDRKGRPIDYDGGFALLVSNKQRFEERFEAGDAMHVLDLRDFAVGNPTLDITGDVLGWQYMGGCVLESVIWFGSYSARKIGAKGDFEGYGPNWTGSTVAVPSRGHSVRRNPCGKQTNPDSAANFIEESAPTPGTKGDDTPEYISVDLGVLGIELDQELSAVETATAYLNSTFGLTPAGYIKIDDEVLGYVTRSDVADALLTLTRAQAGTTAAVHPAGSTVYQYEQMPDGNWEATDAQLVGGVEWVRRPRVDGTTPVVPRSFKVLFSRVESPIFPDDGSWDDDNEDYWDPRKMIVVTQNQSPATTWSAEPPGGTCRARHAMLLIRQMTDDGRVYMNEFRVYAATREVLAAGESEDAVETLMSGDAIKHMLIQFGIPSADITVTDSGIMLKQLTTTKAKYLQVFRDLLRRTGCVLRFGLDDTIEHVASPWNPLRALPDAETTWTRANARTVRVTQPSTYGVAQVILRARDDVNDAVYEARYPPRPLPVGSVVTIDDVLVGGPWDAAIRAEMEWRKRTGLLGVYLEPVGPAEWVRPGQRHLVTWETDTEGTLLQGRNMVVDRVQYSFEFGDEVGRGKTWKTQISLKELVF